MFCFRISSGRKLSHVAARQGFASLLRHIPQAEPNEDYEKRATGVEPLKLFGILPIKMIVIERVQRLLIEYIENSYSTTDAYMAPRSQTSVPQTH